MNTDALGRRANLRRRPFRFCSAVRHERALPMSTEATAADEFMTGEQVDDKFKICKVTRWVWVRRGILPPGIVVAPQVVRWSRAEIEATFNKLKTSGQRQELKDPPAPAKRGRPRKAA
jgi:hypothetical protein